MAKNEQLLKPHVVYVGLFLTKDLRHVRRAAKLSPNVVIETLRKEKQLIVDDVDPGTGRIKIDPETGVGMKTIEGIPTDVTKVKIGRRDEEKDLIEFWGQLDTMMRRSEKRSKLKPIRRKSLNDSIRTKSRIRKIKA
jgi:hypothetical protein